MALKTNLKKLHGTSSDLEENGAPLVLSGGITVFVRRMSSRASQNARKEAEKIYAQELRQKEVPAEVTEKVFLHQLAYGVISGWTGITNEDDTALVFSPADALALISDDELKDFRGEVISFSLEAANYRNKLDEEALGN